MNGVRKAIMSAAIITVIAAMLLSGTSAALKANMSFSPQEVWGKDMGGNYGMIKSMTPMMDLNGDGLAEIMVEMENFSSNQYTVAVLDGASGNVITIKTFTDVGYVETGDNVPIDPVVYGDTLENGVGKPVSEWHFMVFGNHSNNKRLSIYHFNNTNLSDYIYRDINVPQTINYQSLSATVNYYTYEIRTYVVNGDAYLLYIGYYIGNILSYQIGELQIIMMNSTLSTVWERKDIGPVYNGISPFGADVAQFNGYGFHPYYPDVLFINLSASPGNTTLTAIDSATGSVMWNLTIPGIYPMTSPDSALGISVAFDYNRDNRTDLVMPTKDTNKNKTLLNFINGTGALAGYYETSVKNYTIPSLWTDIKTGISHRLVQSPDMNGDGYGEIIFIDNNTRLVCWDVKNNHTLWEDELVNQSWHYMAYLSTNDINGDGIWDIYVMGGIDRDAGGYYVKDVNMTAISGKDGSVLDTWFKNGLVGGYPGTSAIKEITDITGDGMQDSVIAYGYFNDSSGVYVKVALLEMANGTEVWNVNVTTDLYNDDFKNWTTSVGPAGDVNGDGTNDIVVKMYYSKDNNVSTYIRVLSGSDGSLLWTGKVTNDIYDADVVPLQPITVIGGWNQFDYNGDGIINEMYVHTGTTVHVFAVSQPVPEISPYVILMATPMIVFLLRRKIL